MRPLNILYTLLLATALPLQLAANNIQVTNPALTGNNTSTGTCFVQFDISWENSWRLNGVVNWDAAWVFVKYKNPQGLWQHTRLEATGHVLPANAAFDSGLLTPGSAYDPNTNPVIGGFLRRSGEGSGTFMTNGVQLRWNYFAQGIGFNDITEVRVFAVEMVYVNQGVFSLGSGSTEFGSFTSGNWSSGNSIPFLVNSEGSITLGQGSGKLWTVLNSAGGYIGNDGDILPAPYPKGFGAMYCMKYEISQQQYVDFLNTLTRSQQVSRVATDISSFSISNRYVMSASSSPQSRNGIRCPSVLASSVPVTFSCDLNGTGGGGDASDGQWLPCNFLMWTDLSAYLDWSGLRPMSELEFEKLCRGTIAPFPNEFAWGTAQLSASAYTLVNIGADSEGVATNYGAGNASYDVSTSAIGPLRVGIYAANPMNTGRVSAGASFYGAMELSGNLWEHIVNVGSTAGPLYSGNHGNGVLTADGAADVGNWPYTTVPLSGGVGKRGGSWQQSSGFMRVSNRSGADYVDLIRFANNGGRGVRTAP